MTRAEQAADIDLRWASGDRYALGEATFSQAPKQVIRDKLLRKLVRWEPGDAYDEAELDRLRRSLVGLDYFGLVEVSPKPEDADRKRVPVRIDLTPAPRSIYTTGLSYGTESGPGVRLGVERRYLNSRGHKALAQVDYARDRKTLTLQYRVPAFAWLDGWYTASLQAADEQTDFLDTRRVEFVASRSGQYNDYLNLVAALHVLRERWAYFQENVLDDSDPDTLPNYRYASFVFPEPARGIHRRRQPPRAAPRPRRHADAARRRRRWRILRAGGRGRAVVPRLRCGQPPDRARRNRPHLQRRTAGHAAQPAFLRGRRPQHPRLRLAGARSGRASATPPATNSRSARATC